MFKIATLLQACLGLHHPEIYPILVLMHSRFKKGVLPIIRLPAEAIKFAPAYFFCRRKYKWTSKMIWRSFDNLKKPPRLLYAFSFDGYIFVALRNACPSVLSAYIAQVSEYIFIFTVNLLHFYAF